MNTQTLKTTTLGFAGLFGITMMILGSYNTAVVNNDPFSTTIKSKFVKRLDEVNGKIIVGRMAASWMNLEDKKEVAKEVEVKQVIQNNIQTAIAEKALEIPAPTINEDLDLKLSKVFFKEPLQEGTFSGSARTVDGVIEEVSVTLPTGQVISINTREKMVGNIFQYEDSYTREARSGMFYEVKKGTYMITLTNDSQFAGTRLEFEAQNQAEVRYSDEYYERNIGWNVQNDDNRGMNTSDAYSFEAETTAVQPTIDFNFNS